MKCLICDDDYTISQQIVNTVEQYFKTAGIEADVEQFNDSNLCMNAISHTLYDLYILDIVMPEINGIELAKTIRERTKNGIIIFMTSSDSYHTEAFSLEALQYISKPVDTASLKRALERAVIYINGISKHTSYISVVTKSGVYDISYNKIEYIESHRHRLIFHMKSEEILESVTTFMTMNELMSKLGDSCFLSPYKGYLINVNFVDHIEKKCFVMTCGAIIPIPVRNFQTVYEEYMKKLQHPFF